MVRNVVIKDPLYGFIELNRKIKKLINSKEFQRLRYIKQLDFAYLVFPSANHTRFEHSLGVYYLTSLFLDKTRSKNLKEIKDELLVFSLLHDIGHGPFSHASEHYLYPYLKKNHEDIGLKIAIDLIERFDLDLDKKVIESLFKGNSFSKLVDGSIGTDRLDYLKRDSYYTGVEFGKVDSERIIKNLHFDDENKEYFVKEKAIYNIYSLYIARQFMFKAVYFHKTSLLFEKIFGEALTLAVDYLSPFDMFRMTDEELLFNLMLTKDERITELINRIKERKVPKFKIKVELDSFDKRKLEKMEKELKEKYNDIWVVVVDLSNKPFNVKIETFEGLKDLSEIIDLSCINKENIKIYIYSDKEIKKEEILPYLD